MKRRGGLQEKILKNKERNSMKYKIIQLLAFLRLLDENAQISLTNISVMLVLYKMAASTDIDLMAASTLLGIIGAYQFKRYVQRKK